MLDRKKFFTLIGKSALFIGLLKMLPVKFFSNISKKSNPVKIKIHPSAIKRKK